MNQDSDRDLLRALNSLAVQDATLAPPQDLERQLLAKLAEGPPRARARLGPCLFAVAASVLVATLVLSILKPMAVTAGRPFSPLPFAAPAAPYEQLEVRRQAVAVTALIAAGFEVHVADPGGLVTADVLVGQDGRPLAIRLSSEEN